MLETEGFVFSFILVCIALIGLLQLRNLYPVNARLLLCEILLIFMLTRLDDALQASNLLLKQPELLFLGSIAFLFLGPLIYQYVRFRVGLPGHSRLGYVFVLLPPILYLIPYWWLQPVHVKLHMLKDGSLYNPVNMLLWPSYGDLILLTYLFLCVRVLQRFGLQLKDWFSFIEDKNLAGLKSILIWLMIIIFCHLIWTWISWFEVHKVKDLMDKLLLFSQLLFVLALVMEAVASNQLPPSQMIGLGSIKQPKKSIYSDDELAECAELIQEVVAINQLHLESDLSLNQLARVIGQPQKKVSTSLNRNLKQNFHDYINNARIQHAKDLIRSYPQLSLIEIAMQSGFNSKSTFNNAFKKFVEIPPSEYKKIK